MCQQSSELIITVVSIASSKAQVATIMVKVYPQIRMAAAFHGEELITFRAPHQ